MKPAFERAVKAVTEEGRVALGGPVHTGGVGGGGDKLRIAGGRRGDT